MSGTSRSVGGCGDADAYRSVADITDAASLRQVREFEQQQEAAARAAKG